MKNLLTCILLCQLVTIDQLNAQIYVSASATGANNGTSWANAYTSISAAMTAASSGNEIWVAAGNYQNASNTTIAMKEGVKVYGGFTTSMTLLSQANPASHVTTIQGNGKSVLSYSTITSATILDGFTITGGTGTTGSGVGSGGGISLVDASPILSNLIITANTAQAGGGINMSGATSPAVTNVTFLSNVATGGGYGRGGAVYISGSGNIDPVFTSVIFQSNSAAGTSAGGGICQYSATNSDVTINNAIFYNNVASSGGYAGGIMSLSSGSLKITNTVFANNSSTGAGAGFNAGAISNNTTDVTISDCTFYNNLINTGGTAVNTAIQFLNMAATDKLNNSIFYNTGETAATLLIKTNVSPAPTANNCYLPTTTGSGTTFTAGTGNVAGIINPFYGSEPMNLAILQGADGKWMTADDGLHLVSTSSAYSSGNNSLVPAGISTDITGSSRIQNTTVEMGAYEGLFALVPVKLVSFGGALQTGVANLQWKTAAEDNFSHFELQKSIDAKTWTTIGKIAGKGESSSYNFSTAQVEIKGFYRLKINDVVGNYEFSNVLMLSQKEGSKTLQLYPNPAKNYVVVATRNAGLIKIHDASGKMVKSQSIQAGSNTVDISSLTPGINFCEVDGVVFKFIKL